MLKTFKALAGRALPVKVEGKIILITPDKETSIDVSKVDYFTKNSLERAVAEKDISEIPAKKGKPNE